uniref:Uncharacterized protein n=1 Tax=Arundo donax TaxID=35708 RepID=A0A0A9C468_ARUDO
MSRELRLLISYVSTQLL